jgi:hypothetical protein
MQSAFVAITLERDAFLYRTSPGYDAYEGFDPTRSRVERRSDAAPKVNHEPRSRLIRRPGAAVQVQGPIGTRARITL